MTLRKCPYFQEAEGAFHKYGAIELKSEWFVDIFDGGKELLTFYNGRKSFPETSLSTMVGNLFQKQKL